MSEGIIHRKVKEQIAQALQATPGVTNVVLEQHVGPVRADVSFLLSGKHGAVELQLSDKPLAQRQTWRGGTATQRQTTGTDRRTDTTLP